MRRRGLPGKPTRRNKGLGYWTFEPGLLVSYLSQKNGFEATAYIGYDINTRNTETDYLSGQQFHIDVTVGAASAARQRPDRDRREWILREADYRRQRLWRAARQLRGNEHGRRTGSLYAAQFGQGGFCRGSEVAAADRHSIHEAMTSGLRSAHNFDKPIKKTIQSGRTYRASSRAASAALIGGLSRLRYNYWQKSNSTVPTKALKIHLLKPAVLILTATNCQPVIRMMRMRSNGNHSEYE